MFYASAAAQTEDPNQWLEEVQGERALATVRAWNEATLADLLADPRYESFRSEALAILTSEARLPEATFRGDTVEGFWRDAAHPRGQWRTAPVRGYLAGEPRWTVLLDLDALATRENENWVWRGATCAPDDDRCLVRLSSGGTDASIVREFSRRRGQFVADGFVLPPAKSEVEWLDDDTLLVGTDRGPGTTTTSGYPRTVVRWARGTALADAPVVFEGQAQDVGASATVLRHGRRTAVVFQRSVTFFESERWLWVDGALVPLPLPTHSEIVGLLGDELLVLLQDDWTFAGQSYTSGSLVSLVRDAGGFSASRWMEPPPRGAIEAVMVAKDRIYVQVLEDVVGHLLVAQRRGREIEREEVALPGNGVIHLQSTSSRRRDALVQFESLTVPSTQFSVDQDRVVTALQTLPAFYDASDVVVEQHFATSPDGTRVPYFLMAKASVLKGGPAPTIQYGYGGFLNAIVPVYFDEEARPQHGALAGRSWVSRGGVLVLSNLRGGSEYGPAWHDAGVGPDRQRVFDDFFAIGDDLVRRGVTTPAQLGAIGRSNGGLLMGVAFTQRPDLYAAIDCGVPLLDMLRYHQLLAGASWKGEYGDPEVPAERAVLEEYSPYHHVVAGQKYPAILLYTSTLDDRVHPGHARKMAARLEGLGIPFSYWENLEGGHGGVANHDQAAMRLALEYTFLARALGLGDP